ncbi:BCCT family transporter, partial [Vibrio sp. Y176]|uniref:BCCT family transporter n=1 Tax=Vibrio sp. Y176 TaxID=3074704 RepID=UPI0029659D9C
MTKGIDKYSIDSTDYTVGQDNVQKWGFDVHNPVFGISAGFIALFLVAALVLDAHTAKTALDGLKWKIIGSFDWLFIIAGNIFVIFCLALIVSPLGKIRLGGKDAVADYSFMSWLAMLFAAGMGIGLVFFGVSEPMSHFSSALGGVNIENGVRTDWAPLGGAVGDTDAASALGMAATIYHWALHPWSIYALLALGLAIFSFNKGLPLTMRSIFYPLFGERVWGWVGHVIDILAVVA